jgi:hypothetical protein
VHDIKKVTDTLIVIADAMLSGSLDCLRFAPYREEKGLTIYHYQPNEHVELAILRDISRLHLHAAGTAFFMFTKPGALLRLGGINPGDRHAGVYTDYLAVPRVVYPIAPYMLHAAGPVRGGTPVKLLIYNPESARIRSGGAYPDDTHFPAYASASADQEFYV